MLHKAVRQHMCSQAEKQHADCHLAPGESVKANVWLGFHLNQRHCRAQGLTHVERRFCNNTKQHQ